MDLKVKTFRYMKLYGLEERFYGYDEMVKKAQEVHHKLLINGLPYEYASRIFLFLTYGGISRIGTEYSVEGYPEVGVFFQTKRECVIVRGTIEDTVGEIIEQAKRKAYKENFLEVRAEGYHKLLIFNFNKDSELDSFDVVLSVVPNRRKLNSQGGK